MTGNQLLLRCVLGAIGTLIAVVVALIVPSLGWPLFAVCLIVDVIWLLFRVVRVGHRSPRRPGIGAETAGRWFRRQWERFRDWAGHLVHGFRDEKKPAPAARPKRGAPQRTTVPYSGGGSGNGGGGGGAEAVAMAVSPADIPPELQAALGWLTNYDFSAGEPALCDLARALAAFKLAIAMVLDDLTRGLITGEEISPLAVRAMADYAESEGDSAQGALAIYVVFAQHYGAVKSWLADHPDNILPRKGGREGFLRGEGEVA